MIRTKPLFNITREVGEIEDLGSTPYGTRKIAAMAGGSAVGDFLQGTIRAAPNGDWLLLHSNSVLCLDVSPNLTLYNIVWVRSWLIILSATFYAAQDQIKPKRKPTRSDV